MWMMLVQVALAAPLEQVAAEAAALQAEHGAPLIVALPDSEAEIAWAGLPQPAGGQLIPVRADSGAAAFQAVQGLECAVLVTRDGPDDYSAVPQGVCAGQSYGSVASPSDPFADADAGWLALALNPGTLVARPVLQLRARRGGVLYGAGVGVHWTGPRATFQMTSSPRHNGNGVYVGAEGMLRTVQVTNAEGIVDVGSAVFEALDLLNLFSDDSGEPLLRKTFGVGLAPIVGAQYVGDGGLVLAWQAGPQLLVLGDRPGSPFAVRVSGQLLIGFAPASHRAW